ncbi:phosphoglucosamine mutase [Desulfosarcina ovata]|uniref:Phosphoglucosamine mutase n=1 Tax=Desulfosarcina ovata subsp. ovata TaxID=2752305 RepID=A0A5K8A509_9BACT|nr:phosphoglucosamine mutase [Desulfosarcina ovata]BBO87632.1 phosphoglucosamine mutase [Desulfosarcina ovata subsp. ovata]
MGKLFGTDGIRGVANQYPLDCETALKAGRAIAAFFGDQKNNTGRFLIGRDTRISGSMLASSLAAGICSMGGSVWLAGVMPTPGVAYLTANGGYDAGIVISASHNPFGDNGIKLFQADGFKLSDTDERAIEALILESGALCEKSAAIRQTGTIHDLELARQHYTQFLRGKFTSDGSLIGLKLVIDCSNGAASGIATKLFEELGADVIALFCEPDGTNINDNCGSQHPEILAQRVVAEHANLGLAFDGDADRLIVVDENGYVLAGDQIMAICARWMKGRGALSNSLVVSTVMSNLGFGVALKKMGIRHIKAGVGDRYVMEEMVKAGAVLGGEDSGHLIFLNQHTTGDGMLAALNLLAVIQSSKQTLSELATVMTTFPQCLINVDVRSKPPLDSLNPVVREIEAAEKQLGEHGRVLVRYSGTQPQCRVMVEGPTQEETRSLCQGIADVVAQQLG